MLKKDWKKNLLRVKQIADQKVGWAEKSTVLSDDLVSLEKRVDLIKQVCQNFTKKVQGCIQGQGQDVEKRLKKIPEMQLSHNMIESSSLVGPDSLMGPILELGGKAEGSLGRECLQFEMEIEEFVLVPLQSLLENDIPQINRLRKQLSKLTLDMDSARGRYQGAQRQSVAADSKSQASAAAKADNIKDEVEDATTRVEQCRDALATEMYHFVSKEKEYCKRLVKLVEVQAEYYRKALQSLEDILPEMNSHIDHYEHIPVYGVPIEEHLAVSNREVAYVLEECVCTLLEIGMEEEGLFRIAGGASKVKKLKAAFDAGMVDMGEYIHDVHSIAGSLKQYLRELPEPLMTYDLYGEWMQAASLSNEQRLQALWVVANKLPATNYNNLRYLIKFLSRLSENSDVNKMTPSNISIVIGPNLMWARDQDGPNIRTTGSMSAIIESFIQHADWFFPGEIDFGGATTPGPSTPSSQHSPAEQRTDTGSVQTTHNSGAGSGHSPQNSLTVHSPQLLQTGASPSPKQQRKSSKLKPAPLPPVDRTTQPERPPIAKTLSHEPPCTEGLLIGNLNPVERSKSDVSHSESPLIDISDTPQVQVASPHEGPPDRPPIPNRPSLSEKPHMHVQPPERPLGRPPVPTQAHVPHPERPLGPPPDKPSSPPSLGTPEGDKPLPVPPPPARKSSHKPNKPPPPPPGKICNDDEITSL
ncbi:unnamed protein product [Owenia fusiformis]|uniref:Uncharacterized protein n=1 Tax=Owenia fusiformis TaxID=6347 RepID=A0A8S4PN22_OWEFU|nr:unnamed protein product [Owenia fusiformis]